MRLHYTRTRTVASVRLRATPSPSYITHTHLGRVQRGQPGDGPFRFDTNEGYVSPKKADYKGALDKGHDVRVLIHQTFGGMHPSARSLLVVRR